MTMPELDGWQTLERIRDLTAVPVLMLTARDTELEKVRGLKEGADDYVTKPFGRQELLARVEALLRRSAGRTDWGPDRETYGDGRVSVDVTRAEVRVGDDEIQLTPLEFRLLVDLHAQPGPGPEPRPAPRARLGAPGRRSSRGQVKVTLSYLRRKLGDSGELIETVRGFGYRWGR